MYKEIKIAFIIDILITTDSRRQWSGIFKDLRGKTVNLEFDT